MMTKKLKSSWCVCVWVGVNVSFMGEFDIKDIRFSNAQSAYDDLSEI